MKWICQLETGAVVCCRFPTEENPGAPGTKSRPVVIAKLFRSQRTGSLYAEVVYGTSAISHVRDPNLQITRYDELSQTGLRAPTQFLLRKRAVVPATKSFFALNANGDVAIGKLPQRAIEKMERFIIDEPAEQRRRALRFGNFQPIQSWTTSSDHTQEISHA